jgi:polyhydroxyalkanoate synthesis regulator phasin
MNPFTLKPLWEAMEGRDEYGRHRDFQDQIIDSVSSIVPIPFQTKGQERKLWQSVFASIGVNAVRSRTSLEREMLNQYNKKVVRSYPREDRERHALVGKYSDKVQDELVANGSISKDTYDEIMEHVKEGRLYQEDIKSISKRAIQDKVQHLIENSDVDLTMIMEAWPKASDDERAKYYPAVRKKMMSFAKNHPERAAKIGPNVVKMFMQDEEFYQRDLNARQSQR